MATRETTMNAPISIALSQYIGSIGSFAEAGRRFGVTGEAVRHAMMKTDRDLYVRLDPVTQREIDVIEIKKVWTAVAK
jgi:hypothetical protein